MRIGERRSIIAHPDLAYGAGKFWIPPNCLVVFEVLARSNIK